MRTLYFLWIFLLNNIFAYESKDNLKIFWWNLGQNKHSEKSRDHKFSTVLEENIYHFNWDSYDVIVFGEYHHKFFREFAFAKIKKEFKYNITIRYNTEEHYFKKFRIFSKHKFTYTIDELDWVHPLWSDTQKERYQRKAFKSFGPTNTFKRAFVLLNFTINKNNFYLIPYHFNNPWNGISKQFGRYSKKYGKFVAAMSLIFGKRNPLYNQLESMHYMLYKHLGSNYDRRLLAMIGDSNCPHLLRGWAPDCYKKLERVLSIIDPGENKYTYPGYNLKKKEVDDKLRIDHTSASSSFITSWSEVLQIEGSDHNPISLDLVLP
ncbi:hypothetical protein N9N67_07595 [Bacteriovoracaceae bacterium]|nr:hypothetical protein [Bacteriovoracaceae bacterium]